VFPRDRVCLRNINVDTLQKGDTEDNNNNNNNITKFLGKKFFCRITRRPFHYMLQFTCVLKFLLKCAPSSYVLTAQLISRGGLSLSGNSCKVVNTGAMAFVFHGKKLQKTGAWLRLITLHINTLTNTKNKCSINVA
jgi:hypothetical protein